MGQHVVLTRPRKDQGLWGCGRDLAWHVQGSGLVPNTTHQKRVQLQIFPLKNQPGYIHCRPNSQAPCDMASLCLSLSLFPEIQWKY